MKSLASGFFRALVRFPCILAVISLGIAAAMLTITTSPADFTASKTDGQTATVLGIVRDPSLQEHIYALDGFRGGHPLFVLGKEGVPSTALVISRGHRATSDAGRAILVEEKHWAVPLRSANFPNLESVLIQFIPFEAFHSPWIAVVALLLLVVVITRWFGRVLSTTFIAATSLIAGVTLAYAAVEHGLIAITTLPLASICAATMLTAARLKR